MSRYLMTFGLLGATILWLVLSYAPVALPQVAITSATVLAWLPALAMILLGVFALIQLDLVRATVQMLKRPAEPAQQEAVEVFGLRVGREVLLTVLPMAATFWIGWLILAF